MFTLKKYKYLKRKYGRVSSWAIWDRDNKKDTSIIENNFKGLHSRYVFLGLNISNELKGGEWQNFHGGRNDGKLMYACNDTKLRGSYLTDLFKRMPEPNSNNLKVNHKKIKHNVKLFGQEMKDVGVNGDTKFILLGGKVSEYFNRYFNKNIVAYRHYADRSKDKKEWAEGLWKELGVKKDFSQIVKKYKKKRKMVHKNRLL